MITSIHHSTFFVMIEVFKTNVQELWQTKPLLALLFQSFPGSKINFDLHDCDKILRIESAQIRIETILNIIHSNGYCCEVLE